MTDMSTMEDYGDIIAVYKPNVITKSEGIDTEENTDDKKFVQ